MTITQLEYIVAVDNHRNFGLASESCGVTQPTLSLQIQKLEDQLGVKVFDRSKKPIVATDMGHLVLQQARVILSETQKMSEIIQDQSTKVEGHLRIGIISTLAPYLLPLFLPSFAEKYPQVNTTVHEMNTEEIIYQLKSGQMDVGLLATPLEENSLKETPLFYEPFVAYVSDCNRLFEKRLLDVQDIQASEVWLLSEGHCLRNQVIKLCQQERPGIAGNLEFRTGSLEVLKRIVEQKRGITFLPELAIADFSSEQMERVRYFHTPEPVREISIVVHRQDLKRRLIERLEQEILSHVPQKMKKKGNKLRVEVV